MLEGRAGTSQERLQPARWGPVPLHPRQNTWYTRMDTYTPHLWRFQMNTPKNYRVTGLGVVVPFSSQASFHRPKFSRLSGAQFLQLQGLYLPPTAAPSCGFPQEILTSTWPPPISLLSQYSTRPRDFHSFLQNKKSPDPIFLFLTMATWVSIGC